MSDTYYIDPNFPGLAHDGSYTFAGILSKYFNTLDEYSREWNENTAESYLNDYNNRILPTIKVLFGLEKTMASFTEEEFETILNTLSLQYHYRDSTIQHYRFLLWVVYRAGFEHGHYVDSIFWGDLSDASELDNEERKAAAMTRIRKSFTIGEEIKLIRWFQALKPDTATGEDIGLAIMLFQGLRNNETCGLSFQSIRTLSNQIDIPILDIFQTTKLDSNELKIGGKTRNAPRVLPLFGPLYRFLLERKDFLSKISDTSDLSQLPIVCRGNNFTARANTHDLTKAGHMLFEKVGISRSELGLLQQILFDPELQATQIEEKDVTPYLFSRHVGTRLYQLGFTSVEVQYWMGHDIEDAILTRNTFSDDEILAKLAEKYRQHPAYIFFESDREHAPQVSSGSCPVGRQSYDACFRFESFTDDILLRATAIEPGDAMSVDIQSDSPFKTIVQESYIPSEFPASANITQLIKNAFRNELEKTDDVK